MDYRLSLAGDKSSVVRVEMRIRHIKALMENGSKEVLEAMFPGMLVKAEEGFDVAVEFDCDKVEDKEGFLEKISNLKLHCESAPLLKAFQSLAKDECKAGNVTAFNFRKSDTMYICPRDGKVVVVMMLDFDDDTEKALAKVYIYPNPNPNPNRNPNPNPNPNPNQIGISTRVRRGSAFHPKCTVRGVWTQATRRVGWGVRDREADKRGHCRIHQLRCGAATCKGRPLGEGSGTPVWVQELLGVPHQMQQNVPSYENAPPDG